jgi:hypothetical protein
MIGEVYNNQKIVSEKFLRQVGKNKYKVNFVLAQCLHCNSSPRAVIVSRLILGKIKGCVNCFQRRAAESRIKTNTVNDYLYHVLAHAKNRCVNTKHVSYPNYGGRGISFFPLVNGNLAQATALVRNSIGERPTPDHQLDRYPNNDGNYEVGNIRWATRSENNFNRRTPTSRLSEKDLEITELKQKISLLVTILYLNLKYNQQQKI